MDNVNFGNKGKFGKIDIAKLQQGGFINQKDLQKPGDIKLFEKFGTIDKDKNGILTQKEMTSFLSGLSGYANDGKITKREAKKFLTEQGIDAKSKDLLKFLQTLGVQFDNDVIAKAYEEDDFMKVEFLPGEDDTVTLVYKNGEDYSTEVQKRDGSKVIILDKEENGITRIEINGAVTQYFGAGQGPVKQVTDKGNGLKETIEYEYNENGDISKTTKTFPDGTKEVTEGNKVTKFNDKGEITAIKETNDDGSYTITDSNGEVTKYNADGIEIKDTPQDILQKAFKDGKARVTIDGTASGLSSKEYEGEIRLPKGEKLEDGKFPNTLNMTLPDSYGQNAVMKLTLVDAEKGIYETTRGDRKFQISTDNGEITMKAVVTEELNNKLKANLANDKNPVNDDAATKTTTFPNGTKEVTEGNTVKNLMIKEK